MVLAAPNQNQLRSRSSIQAVRLATDEAAQLTIGAASVRTSVGVSADYVMLLADDPCYINIGDGTVVAAATNTKIPAGLPFIIQIERGQYIACLQVAASTGVLGITPAY